MVEALTARAKPWRSQSGTGVAEALVDGIDGLQHLLGKVHLGRGQRHVELRNAGRTDDVRGHEGTAGDESVGKQRRFHAEAARQFVVGKQRLGGIRCLVTLASIEEGRAGACRKRAVVVLAGQIALRQRRVGKQPDVFAVADLGEVHLEGPVDEVVGVLDRDRARTDAAIGLGRRYA